MDTLGEILWFSMFFTPFITIPLAWILFKERKFIKIIIGILLAVLLSAFLYLASMTIILRDGLGPT